MYQISEADWKLFRSKIGAWQEAYMDKLTRGYIELLSSGLPPSEKFWELNKRLKEDKRKVGVQVDMRRSLMISNILSLLSEGAITLDDLEPFSDELREQISYVLGVGQQ